MMVAFLSMFRLNMRYTYSGSWENEKAAVPLALYCEDDFRRVNLLQQPREGKFVVLIFSENLFKVASLIVKITNQVIRSCKRYITENGNLTIWAQVRSLESILKFS